jgi:hypothetical protein
VRTHGATKYFLDKAGRRALERYEGRDVPRLLGHKLDTFVVVDDDDGVITAGYRRRRIGR